MKTLWYNSVLIAFFAFFMYATDANATNHQISRVDVTGNNRIDDNTILNYAKLSVGSVYNQADVDDFTPLYVACTKGLADIARLLLERGATINQATTEDGITPLHVA